MVSASDLKKRLAHHLFWRLKYSVVCDEFQFCDVVGIRNSGYLVEFEVKISKSDFNREMRCITSDECEKYGKDWEKFVKHKFYLTGEFPKTDYDRRMESLGIFANTQEVLRPSEFYFYVTDEIADWAALKVVEAGLPYGVIRAGQGEYPGYHVVRVAEKLHKDKSTPLLYRQLAHALTVRSRLLQWN